MLRRNSYKLIIACAKIKIREDLICFIHLLELIMRLLLLSWTYLFGVKNIWVMLLSLSEELFLYLLLRGCLWHSQDAVVVFVKGKL